MRARAFIAVLALVASTVAVGGASASRRCHPHGRVRCKSHRPAPLPRRLEVDENDQGQPPQPYTLRPSHNPVGKGKVEFNVYNFGQDAHTFAVIDSKGGRLTLADVPANQPDAAVTLSVPLGAGHYTLECTLPSHAALGMRATLTVK